MKAFVGTGHGSPKDAVAQATQGLSAPQAILFMAPYDMAGEVAALLTVAYPDTPSIGTIGTKLANGQVSDTNVAVLGLFEDAKTSLGVIEHISACPVACAGEIERRVSQVSPGRDDTDIYSLLREKGDQTGRWYGIWSAGRQKAGRCIQWQAV